MGGNIGVYIILKVICYILKYKTGSGFIFYAC